MPRNGLSKEKVIEAAVALIEHSGTADFSMRALADSLQIKTASLYNHVDSMEALMVGVCAYALQMQREQEMNAVEGKSHNDAIIALRPLLKIHLSATNHRSSQPLVKWSMIWNRRTASSFQRWYMQVRNTASPLNISA